MALNELREEPDEPDPGLSDQQSSLEPLQRPGPDALATGPGDPVKNVKAIQILYHWQDLAHEQVAITAEDVYALPETDHDPLEALPRGAKPIEATLTCELRGSGERHTIVLRPPAPPAITPARHAAPILAWLARSQFMVLRALGRAPVVLLAVGGILLAALDASEEANELVEAEPVGAGDFGR